jgi:hypothetical protein
MWQIDIYYDFFFAAEINHYKTYYYENNFFRELEL